MAHTNQTPNYELSQFLGTDKPAWLVDYNGDMEKIDLGLKDAKDVADAAKAEADQGAIDIAAVTITANSADAIASGAISDLADAYNFASTYNIGDYVIYNSILYRCIVQISVPESFDGNHWARTTVEEMIEGLNNTLDQLNSDLTYDNYSTTDNVKYKKVGFGLVEFHIQASNIASNTVLGTLPEGYRPQTEMWYSNTAGVLGRVTVYENGQVIFSGSGTSTVYCVGHFLAK